MTNKVTCHLDPSDVSALVSLLGHAAERLYNIDDETNTEYSQNCKRAEAKALELQRFFIALQEHQP